VAVTVLSTPTQNGATGVANPSDPYTSFTHTCPAGSNRLLLLMIATGDGGARLIDTAPTYGGQTMTRVGSGADGGTWPAADCWYLNESGIAAAANTTFSLDTTPGGAGIQDLGLGAVVLEGVDQATPVDGVQTSSGTGVTAGVTVTSATDDLVVAVLGTDADAITQFAANGTAFFEVGGMSGDTCGGGQYMAGSASVNISWTQDSFLYAVIGFNVNAAAAGSTSASISASISASPSATPSSSASPSIQGILLIERPVFDYFD
jgi:hypothetical protein